LPIYSFSIENLLVEKPGRAPDWRQGVRIFGL
jgi:hypothetical protein